MNSLFRLSKKNIILAIISLLLGCIYTESVTYRDVYPCIDTPRCVISDMRGDFTVKSYGYPAPFRETVYFVTKDRGSGVKERRKIDILIIAANIAFWYISISLLIRGLKYRQSRQKYHESTPLKHQPGAYPTPKSQNTEKE